MHPNETYANKTHTQRRSFATSGVLSSLGVGLAVLIHLALLVGCGPEPCTKAADCSTEQFCDGSFCAAFYVEGKSCQKSLECKADLVCAGQESAKTCTNVSLCTSDANCSGGLGCFTQADSRDQGVCIQPRDGPKFETICRVRIEEATTPGTSWDANALGNARFADPYVQLKIGKQIFKTTAKTDTEKAVWSSTSPDYTLGEIARMTALIYDQDVKAVFNPDSDDLIASWTLKGNIEWSGQAKEQSLTLKAGQVALKLTILCD